MEAREMTEEQAIKGLKETLCSLCDYVSQNMDNCDIKECDNRDYIKALEQQPSDDCVSRQAVLDILSHYAHNFGADNEIKALSSVTPTHGTCKDCKHWKDSDGVYRRGIGAESKCPVNNSRVFEGTFCCAAFEKRGGEE